MHKVLNACTELLFCQLDLLFFHVLVAVAVVVYLRSLKNKVHLWWKWDKISRKKQNCSIYARQLQQGSRFNQPICWRPQKLMEKKLQSSEGKFLLPKMLDAWMHNFYNFPKFSFGVCMQPGQAWPSLASLSSLSSFTRCFFLLIRSWQGLIVICETI